MSINLINNENVEQENTFNSSIIFWFWKSELKITNLRFLGAWRRFRLGFIPTGTENSTFTLNNIASVTTSQRFGFGSFIVGLLVLILGLVLLGSAPFGGVILSIIGITSLLNAFNTVLRVTNNAGQVAKIPVVIWQKADLVRFSDKVNEVLATRSAQQ